MPNFVISILSTSEKIPEARWVVRILSTKVFYLPIFFVNQAKDGSHRGQEGGSGSQNMVSQMETSLGEDKDNDLSDEIVVGHLNLHIPKKGKESCIWPNFKCVWWKRNWHQHFSHQSGRLVASFEIRFIPKRQHFSITRSPHCLVTFFIKLNIFMSSSAWFQIKRTRWVDQLSWPSSDIYSCLKIKRKKPQPLWYIRVIKFNPGKW